MTNFNWLTLDTNNFYYTLQGGKNLNLEIEGKISLLVVFIQRFVTQSKLSLIFTKTLLFPHKTAYFSNNSHNAYKNADGNSKFNISKLNAWKLTFWKQLVIAKDDIKVSVILANKYEVKAKNFIIPEFHHPKNFMISRHLKNKKQ